MENKKNIESFDIPILLIIFNRERTTTKVLESIRRIKPKRIYIASDGPRHYIKDENLIVNSVRDTVLSSIDWECEIKTLFRDNNLGCGLGVKSAIDWFFKNEEKGIILEDDVVPNISFYRYCDELLKRYENDDRIAQISGANHIGCDLKGDSYTFSIYKSCWGWATWKRAWSNMDIDMKWLGTHYENNIIENMGYSKISVKHWKNALKLIANNDVDAWDWQWYFTIASQNQLTIFPKYNLVANVGFGNDATHTKGKAPEKVLNTKELEFPLVHPRYITKNNEFDKMFEIINIKQPWIKTVIPKRAKRFIKKIIGRE